VLTEAETPLRCKDLCHALDTGTEPARIEGMRYKLKRLAAAGLVTENVPGLFAIPRPRTGP
jgi:F420-0:gamma-glutamyl ligase-like protein